MIRTSKDKGRLCNPSVNELQRTYTQDSMESQQQIHTCRMVPNTLQQMVSSTQIGSFSAERANIARSRPLKMTDVLQILGCYIHPGQN